VCGYCRGDATLVKSGKALHQSALAYAAPPPSRTASLLPRMDTGVPKEGLYDGSVAMPSRPVKRSTAILQGKEVVVVVVVVGGQAQHLSVSYSPPPHLSSHVQPSSDALIPNKYYTCYSGIRN